MFKRSSNHYGETPSPETPYQKAGQIWDDRIGGVRLQARNWRYATFFSLLLASVLSAGLIWQGTRSIVTPYVVEVSETGVTRAVGPAIGSYNPTDAQIAWHLGQFIHHVRSISIDPVVVRQNWLSAYDHTTDRAAATLNTYARENDPFADIGRKSVSVDIVSIVRSTGETFEVRWQETIFRNGQKERVDRFTGSLTLIVKPPRTADVLRKNPLGIYVHAINWSQDHIPGEQS